MPDTEAPGARSIQETASVLLSNWQLYCTLTCFSRICETVAEYEEPQDVYFYFAETNRLFEPPGQSDSLRHRHLIPKSEMAVFSLAVYGAGLGSRLRLPSCTLVVHLTLSLG